MLGNGSMDSEENTKGGELSAGKKREGSRKGPGKGKDSSRRLACRKDGPGSG